MKFQRNRSEYFDLDQILNRIEALSVSDSDEVFQRAVKPLADVLHRGAIEKEYFDRLVLADGTSEETIDTTERGNRSIKSVFCHRSIYRFEFRTERSTGSQHEPCDSTERTLQTFRIVVQSATYSQRTESGSIEDQRAAQAVLAFTLPDVYLEWHVLWIDGTI